MLSLPVADWLIEHLSCHSRLAINTGLELRPVFPHVVAFICESLKSVVFTSYALFGLSPPKIEIKNSEQLCTFTIFNLNLFFLF